MNSCRELLERMISFDTVNGTLSKKPHPERGLALYLEELASSWGLRTRRCPVTKEDFNLLVTCAGSPDADWLLFDSHLDTVSMDGMIVDPLIAKLEGGRVFGRGACDTKGSGAAMLWALRQYALTPSRGLNIGLLFSLDEESGMTGAQAFTRKELGELAFRTRGIIVGEPTSMRPVMAHGGLVRGKILTHGCAAHSADPEKGSSAISLMVKVIHAFESMYVPLVTARHPLAGKAAASINVIHGGTQVNIIPERCEIEFDRRLMPGENATEVLSEIGKLLDGVRVSHSDAEISFEAIFTLDPLDPQGRNAFTRFVAAALQKENLDASPVGAPWATNASHFATLIPAVVLGPGNIAQAHTSDEWISVSELDLAARIYLGLMIQD